MTLTSQPIPGGWTERELTIRGVRFPLLLPADPETVLLHFEEHAESKERIGIDPYWAHLWPTSLVLAEKILASDWSGQRTAIELGCGIGLAGLAALAAGLEVTFTDYNPRAVELALENARRCGFENASGFVLDWRSPPAMKFDVILASDVIYDRDFHVPLMNTLETLAHERSLVWIGDGGRGATEDFLFLALERWPIDIFDRDDQPSASIHLQQYRRLFCHPRLKA
jgi:predicted nicotinamide N-methyase